MVFKTENDRQLVIRSLTLLTNNDVALATSAVDKSDSIIQAIKIIIDAKGFCVSCR